MAFEEVGDRVSKGRAPLHTMLVELLQLQHEVHTTKATLVPQSAHPSPEAAFLSCRARPCLLRHTDCLATSWMTRHLVKSPRLQQGWSTAGRTAPAEATAEQSLGPRLLSAGTASALRPGSSREAIHLAWERDRVCRTPTSRAYKPKQRMNGVLLVQVAVVYPSC